MFSRNCNYLVYEMLIDICGKPAADTFKRTYDGRLNKMVRQLSRMNPFKNRKKINWHLVEMVNEKEHALKVAKEYNAASLAKIRE